MRLLFRRYAKTLNRLLNRFVVHPRGKPVFFNKGNGRIVLLCKRSCKIPCLHHIHIVFFRTYGGGKGIDFGSKLFFKVKTHQHPQPETHRVRMCRLQPFFDYRQKLPGMLCKNARSHAVANSPVCYIRKERFNRFYGEIKITDALRNVCMNKVLLVIFMRQCGKKFVNSRIFSEPFCNAAELRRAHADNAFPRNVRNQLCRKIRIFFIARGKYRIQHFFFNFNRHFRLLCYSSFHQFFVNIDVLINMFCLKEFDAPEPSAPNTVSKP